MKNLYPFWLLLALFFNFLSPFSTFAFNSELVAEFVMCTDAMTTDPTGDLFDSGGANGNYSNNESCSFLINPNCALSIDISFSSFFTESCCDFFRIYDGPDTNAPLLLTHGGSSIPNNVTATSGMAYIEFFTDSSVTGSGWEMSWTSQIPTAPPVANFSIDLVNPPLNSPIEFTDLTSNLPNSWNWDFGDGNTSTEQNPIYSYTSPGVFDVQLIIDNCFALDTTMQQITVQQPSQFSGNTDPIDLSLECGQDSLLEYVISNNGMGDLIYNLSQQGDDFSAESSILYDFTNVTNHIFSNLPLLGTSLTVEVTINGDFDGTTEFAELFIEGTFIEQIEDNNISNGTDIIKVYNFSGAIVSDWLADGTLEVTIENSIDVDLGVGGLNLHKVEIEGDGFNWFNISPIEGTIAAGDSTIISLMVNTDDLNAGTFSEIFTIATNDANNPLINIPVNLTVVGEPEIIFSADCLDFPTIMQFTSNELMLIISNDGCDDLDITI